MVCTAAVAGAVAAAAAAFSTVDCCFATSAALILWL